MEILQPRVGDWVRVRRRRWTVLDVDSYEGCRVLTLQGREQDGLGERCRIIQPFDDVEQEVGSPVPRWAHLRTWRSACLALLTESASPVSLRTAAAARIELLPYQFEPTLALLGGHGVRVLIADEVGLGKTVQAMLALAELRRRGMVTRALVLTPAGLREQWADECARRFDLPLAVADQAGLRRLRATMPAGVNPWAIEPLVVASLDYVKRPEVLPAVLAAHWDLVVVDEAHGACGQTDRHDAVSALCDRAPYVLLLTATPHSGDEATFASLCRIGQHADPLVVFRRSRREVGRDAGRRVHTVRVGPTPPEARMHAALAALTRAVLHEGPAPDRHAWLLLSLLHKRALSSPFSLAASVERRLQLLAGHGSEPTLHQQLRLPMDDEAGELDEADAAPMWSMPAMHDAGRERRLLEHLLDAARHAIGREAKLRRLHRLLRRIGEPAIVFTEYRDTLVHVRNQVAPDASIIHGGLSRDQRQRALQAFAQGGVLLATDAAGEGLNLHERCRIVVNLELPWNPMRLEQRIGRVDRIGQRRAVHVFHLVSSGSRERLLLDRLTSRISHARATVGAPDPFVDRPQWSDEQSAHLIVAGQEASASDAPVHRATTIPLTRLVAEACVAAAEVGSARTFIAAAHRRTRRAPAAPDRQPRVGDASARGHATRKVSADGPLLSRPRRASSRAALARKALLIFRSRMTDAAGRVVATRVDAALVADDASGTHALADLAQSARIAVASAAQAPWDEALAIHDRAAQLRLARARSIAARGQHGPSEQQPGLFDRRVERTWIDRVQQQQAVVAHDEEHVARAGAAAQVSVSEPELRLVLRARRREPAP